jgi:hypothetical protein
MLLKEVFCSSLKNDIKGEKEFLSLFITIARGNATRVPPKKAWRNPWRGYCRLKYKTRNGSTSTITLANKNVGKSM